MNNRNIVLLYNIMMSLADIRNLHKTLCSDISKEYTVPELKKIVSDLGIAVTGQHKADYCNALATYLFYAEKDSKYMVPPGKVNPYEVNWGQEGGKKKLRKRPF